MKLFSPIAIGSLRLRNRVVVAPMSGNEANPDGSLGPEVAEYYARRARGGVGLIVTGALFVLYPPNRDTGRRYCSLHADEMIPGLRAVVDGVHAGGAAIFGQLAALLHPPGLTPADLGIEQVHEMRAAFVSAA